MKEYIIGVDGGNTKTDYFLFDTAGNFIDFYRGGTCSHEGLQDSFTGSYRVMNGVFSNLLTKNNISIQQIKTAVFGLAGVDTPFQKSKLEEVVQMLGFNNFKVVNDSFLGIKAGTTKGYGVCSINGTGTSSGGIDLDGKDLQVGGIGAIVGDEAGGSWIARQAIRAVYDAAYRFGPETLLTEIVMRELGVNDKYYLMEAISSNLTQRKINLTTLTIAVFECANNNDIVAIQILKNMADNLARSAGGCIINLHFPEEVDVVLAGSVWVKGSCPILIKEFTKKINEYTNKKCNIITLNVPPATGAIVWALELANGSFPDLKTRKLISGNVEKELGRIEHHE